MIEVKSSKVSSMDERDLNTELILFLRRLHNQTPKYINVVKGVMGRGVKGVRYRSIATKCLRTAAYGESHQKRVRSASPPPFRCEMFVRCRS